jgi:hypothetical protein
LIQFGASFQNEFAPFTLGSPSAGLTRRTRLIAFALVETLDQRVKPADGEGGNQTRHCEIGLRVK